MKNKTPTLKEVREHFKDAKVVRSTFSGILSSPVSFYYFEDGSIHGRNGNDDIEVWNEEDGYAEIVEYKEIDFEEELTMEDMGLPVKPKPMKQKQDETEFTLSFETCGGVDVMMTSQSLDNLVTIANMIK